MIKFTKMHGLGNDYVYIDCTKNEKVQDSPCAAGKNLRRQQIFVGCRRKENTNQRDV